MSSTVKWLVALGVTAVTAGANAQYPPQPVPYPQPAAAYQCAPAAKAHWSPFAWLKKPKANTAPALKKAEYPLGFPHSPYVRSPRDYFMQD